MFQSINYILSGIIMILTPIIFARIVLNKKIQVEKIKLAIIFIVCVSLYILLYKYTTGLTKTLLGVAFHTLMFKILYDISFSKGFLLMFIFSIITLIPDILELVIATELLNISKDYYYGVYAGSFFSNLVVCTLGILLTILLRKSLNKILNYKLENNKKTVILSILTLICVGIIFYNLIAIYQFSNNIIWYIIAIIVFLSILFSLYKQKMENSDLVNNYEKLLDYMKTYESEIELQRMLRHETKNQLLTIKSKVVDGMNEEEMLKYIDEILKDNTKIFNKEKYAKYQYLPANGLKALFYFKTEEAEDKGVDVAINVSSQIENSFLNNLPEDKFNELGKILGVYLDNAIEASMLSDKKNMGIEVYMLNNSIEMIISNTYIGSIDNEKIGKSVFSTKGKTRGHGLLLVNSILSKNKHIKVKTEISPNLYIQKIIIKESIVN